MIYICTFKYTVQHWEMLLFFLVLLLFFTIIIYNIWLRVKLILTKRKNTSCIPHFTEGNEGQRGCVTCLKKHIRVRLNIQVFWPWLVFFFNNDILHVRQSSKSVQSLFFFFFSLCGWITSFRLWLCIWCGTKFSISSYTSLILWSWSILYSTMCPRF